MNIRTMTTMFYDGGCPICMKEVKHYRRLDRAGRIRWIDIVEGSDELASLGLTKVEAMKQLHALDSTGNVVRGIWAFAAVWESLPYYRYLAKILRVTYTLPALQVIYSYFARWRFNRRCAEGACGITSS